MNSPNNTIRNSMTGAVAGAAASQASSAAQTSATSKFGNAVTGFVQRVSSRFQQAAEGYRFEYGRLRGLKTLTVDVASLQAMRVSGVLICETNREVVPLQEGSNFFKYSDKGLQRSKRPENPYERPQLTISVVGDRLIREEAEGSAQKYLTNDRLILGNRTYVVKVLPDEYRREQRVKGETHV